MINAFSLLSFRAENLKNGLSLEALQILGEICKQHVVSIRNSEEYVLQGNFSAETVSYVLEQLDCQENFSVHVFPNGKTTLIKSVSFNLFNILSFRAENLRKTLNFEETQILGELCKQYIISKTPREYILQGNFSSPAVIKILRQLGVTGGFRVSVFPNSKTTLVQFE